MTTKLTYQDVINQGILDALTEAYPDPTSAAVLLTAIGFPTRARPHFPVGGDPRIFWAEICRQIQNGAFLGGFEALVAAAAQQYPANPVFKQDRESGSTNPSQRMPAASSARSPRKIRVFLCHSSNDKPQVRKLYAKLKADGFEPWLDEEDLLPGMEWEIEIEKVVRTSQIVVVCLSNNATSHAGYIHKEIKFALDVADRQPENTIFIIPLKLEPCEVPSRLTRWHWVNYYDEGGYQKLKRALEQKA